MRGGRVLDCGPLSEPDRGGRASFYRTHPAILANLPVAGDPRGPPRHQLRAAAGANQLAEPALESTKAVEAWISANQVDSARLERQLDELCELRSKSQPTAGLDESPELEAKESSYDENDEHTNQNNNINNNNNNNGAQRRRNSTNLIGLEPQLRCQRLMEQLDALVNEHLDENDKLNLSYYLNEFETKSWDLSELLTNLLQNLLAKLPNPMIKYRLLNYIKQIYVEPALPASVGNAAAATAQRSPQLWESPIIGWQNFDSWRLGLSPALAAGEETSSIENDSQAGENYQFNSGTGSVILRRRDFLLTSGNSTGEEQQHSSGGSKHQLDRRLFEATTRRYLVASNALMRRRASSPYVYLEELTGSGSRLLLGGAKFEHSEQAAAATRNLSALTTTHSYVAGHSALRAGRPLSERMKLNGASEPAAANGLLIHQQDHSERSSDSFSLDEDNNNNNDIAGYHNKFDTTKTKQTQAIRQIQLRANQNTTNYLATSALDFGDRLERLSQYILGQEQQGQKKNNDQIRRSWRLVPAATRSCIANLEETDARDARAGPASSISAPVEGRGPLMASRAAATGGGEHFESARFGHVAERRLEDEGPEGEALGSRANQYDAFHGRPEWRPRAGCHLSGGSLSSLPAGEQVRPARGAEWRQQRQTPHRWLAPLTFGGQLDLDRPFYSALAGGLPPRPFEWHGGANERHSYEGVGTGAGAIIDDHHEGGHRHNEEQEEESQKRRQRGRRMGSLVSLNEAFERETCYGAEQGEQQQQHTEGLQIGGQWEARAGSLPTCWRRPWTPFDPAQFIDNRLSSPPAPLLPSPARARHAWSDVRRHAPSGNSPEESLAWYAAAAAADPEEEEMEEELWLDGDHLSQVSRLAFNNKRRGEQSQSWHGAATPADDYMMAAEEPESNLEPKASELYRARYGRPGGYYCSAEYLAVGGGLEANNGPANDQPAPSAVSAPLAAPLAQSHQLVPLPLQPPPTQAAAYGGVEALHAPHNNASADAEPVTICQCTCQTAAAKSECASCAISIGAMAATVQRAQHPAAHIPRGPLSEPWEGNAGQLGELARPLYRSNATWLRGALEGSASEPHLEAVSAPFQQAEQARACQGLCCSTMANGSTCAGCDRATGYAATQPPGEPPEGAQWASGPQAWREEARRQRQQQRAPPQPQLATTGYLAPAGHVSSTSLTSSPIANDKLAASYADGPTMHGQHQEHYGRPTEQQHRHHLLQQQPHTQLASSESAGYRERSHHRRHHSRQQHRQQSSPRHNQQQQQRLIQLKDGTATPFRAPLNGAADDNSDASDSGLSVVATQVGQVGQRLPSAVAEQMREQASNFVNQYGSGSTARQRGKRSGGHKKPNLQVRRTLRVKIQKSKPILGIAIEGGFNVSGQLLPRIVCVHEDGAAYQCGKLRASDLILEVNGKSTINMTHDEIAKTIATAYYQDPRTYIEFLIGESINV